MDKTETIKKLLEGNQKYLTSEKGAGDISPRIRLKTAGEGQNPYAIIITCSDSRVIPEAIFQCGIGDLFVIRLAGNVIDNHQLGSIEYAADHLGTKLIMVLGHTHCGAVDAAIHHDPEGYIKFITDEITKAIGEEKDVTVTAYDSNGNKLTKDDVDLKYSLSESDILNIYENNNDPFKLKIKGQKGGSSTLTVTDEVSGKSHLVNISVLNHPIQLTVTADSVASVTGFNMIDFCRIYDTVKVSAVLRGNEHSYTNAFIKIVLPKGMKLLNGNDATIHITESISNPKTYEWDVEIDGNISYGTKTIIVQCGADNVETYQIRKEIVIPSSSVFDNYNDSNSNEIRWGNKITGLLGNEKKDEWTGMDNLCFLNQNDSKGINWGPIFKMGEVPNYKIDERHKSHYLDLLTEGMWENEKAYIYGIGQNSWWGECEGMSRVVALMRAGYLTPSVYADNDESVVYAHDLNDPQDNHDLRDVLHFYCLQQYLPDMMDIRGNYNKTHFVGVGETLYSRNEEDWLKQIVNSSKMVSKGGMPVLVTIDFYYDHDYDNGLIYTEHPDQPKYSAFSSFDDKKFIFSGEW